jgi:hypothetical protein
VIASSNSRATSGRVRLSDADTLPIVTGARERLRGALTCRFLPIYVV